MTENTPSGGAAAKKALTRPRWLGDPVRGVDVGRFAALAPLDQQLVVTNLHARSSTHLIAVGTAIAVGLVGAAAGQGRLDFRDVAIPICAAALLAGVLIDLRTAIRAQAARDTYLRYLEHPERFTHSPAAPVPPARPAQASALRSAVRLGLLMVVAKVAGTWDSRAADEGGAG